MPPLTSSAQSMSPAALHHPTSCSSLQLLVLLRFPSCLYSPSQRRRHIPVSSPPVIPCLASEGRHWSSSPVTAFSLSFGAGSVSSCLQGFLIERAGRKTLLWKNYTVMALALGLLTVTLSLQDSFFWIPYCSVALVFIFIMSFGIGPAGVLCPLLTEIFIHSYRPAAYVFNGVTNWIQLFILGLSFPFIVEGLGNFCFIIFLTYCLSMAIFVFLVLPETKGKTMLQVMEDFNRLNYRGKNGQAVLQQSNCSVMTVTKL